MKRCFIFLLATIVVPFINGANIKNNNTFNVKNKLHYNNVNYWLVNNNKNIKKKTGQDNDTIILSNFDSGKNIKAIKKTINSYNKNNKKTLPEKTDDTINRFENKIQNLQNNNTHNNNSNQNHRSYKKVSWVTVFLNHLQQ